MSDWDPEAEAARGRISDAVFATVDDDAEAIWVNDSWKLPPGEILYFRYAKCAHGVRAQMLGETSRVLVDLGVFPDTEQLKAYRDRLDSEMRSASSQGAFLCSPAYVETRPGQFRFVSKGHGSN